VLEVCAYLARDDLWAGKLVEERWFQLHQANLLRSHRPPWS
jgi:hypothetical protein